jgi:hypothetical protein
MDTSSDLVFFGYVAILGLTGLAFFGIGIFATIAAIRQSQGAKAIIVGLACVLFLGGGAGGYAGYLIWEYLTKDYFEYTLYWKVLIIPVVAVIGGISYLNDLRKKKRTEAQVSPYLAPQQVQPQVPVSPIEEQR